MAMACFGFVTFLPLRPDFSLPVFISRTSLSTFLPADGEYLRLDDFFELDFFLVAFFVAITVLLGGQMAPLFRQVVCDVFASAQCRAASALNNASHAGNAYKRIGDEPGCNACE